MGAMKTKRTRFFVMMIVIAGGLSLVARLSYSDDAGAGGGGGGGGDDWTAPADAAKKANPIKSDNDSIEAGKKIFIQTCIACHGTAGKGDGPAAGALFPPPKDLSDPAITTQADGSLFWKISTGKNAMPAFGVPPAPGKPPQLSETDRWQVINYLRALCPPPATQPGH
jgi:mono/diheme cytochrome c family protein